MLFKCELVVLGLEVVHSQVRLLGLCQQNFELGQLSLLLRLAEHDFKQITQRVLQGWVALLNQIVLDETPHVHNLMWETYFVLQVGDRKDVQSKNDHL